MSANTEAQGSGRGLEAMKWVVVVALLLVAIVGNYLYRDIMLPLRALAVVAEAAQQGQQQGEKGKSAFHFGAPFGGFWEYYTTVWGGGVNKP